MSKRFASRIVTVLTSVLVLVTVAGCASGTTDEQSADSSAPSATSTSTSPTSTAVASAPSSSTTATAPATAGADVTLVSLDPTVTGEGISGDFGNHAIGGPAGEARGELLVFFPGTGAEPDWYSTFLEHAAGLGYHVIGLAYPNDLAVNFDLCQGSTDPSCALAARGEILYGIDASGLALDVSPAEAAIPRLVAALERLARTEPDGGWDRYLGPDAMPVWSKVATAGHSQGGGHAAFLARTEELARVVLLDATEPSPWTTEPMATPAERMWGLAHAEEPIVAPIERSWENLGLPGEAVDIDAGAAPWNGSHRLITSTDECRGDPTSRGFHHNCPVVDDYLPDPIPDSLVAAWDLILTG